MSQACYGVSEIPDGDFFCDRCRAVQILADNKDENDEDNYFNPDTVRDVIKCCFCPVYHGGYKATTDGRWIHLCCALWSQDSIIIDLNEMSPIDVSTVNVQEYKEIKDEDEEEEIIIIPDPIILSDELTVIFPIAKTKEQELKEQEKEIKIEQNKEKLQNESDITHGQTDNNLDLNSNLELNLEISEACMYCGAYGGYVVRCGGHSNQDGGPGSEFAVTVDVKSEETEGGSGSGSGSKMKKEKCSSVFHPLCAWFEGVYVRTNITDPTFQVMHNLFKKKLSWKIRHIS